MLGGKHPFPASIDGIMEGQQASEESARSTQSDDTRDTIVANNKECTPERVPHTLKSLPNIRVMSSDIEKESQKVRSLYDTGDTINWEDGRTASSVGGERLEPTPEVPLEENEDDPYDFLDVPCLHPDQSLS
jgi:hypothetical protein